MNENTGSAIRMSSSKPTVSGGATAKPSWYFLIEPFHFVAFAGHRPPSKSLLRDALEVRERLYRKHFGNTPLAEPDGYDEHAIHVLVYLGDQAISSCRIVSQASPLGLELTRYADLRGLCARDRVYAEVSRLALEEEYRRITSRSFLLVGLLKTALAVAENQRFSDYLIWVRLELRALYRSFGFADVALTFPHAKLGNAVHQVMQLDMRTLQANNRSHVSRLFFDPLPSNIEILL
jgi:predicted GNAT family N-acyltransferase